MASDSGEGVGLSLVSLQCTEHRNAQIIMYCEEHGSPACALCIHDYHRKCNDVKRLDQLSKKLPKSKEFKHFNSSLDEVRQKLEKMKRKRSEDLNNLRTETDQAIHDIKEFRKDINSVLDMLERKGKEFSERRYKRISKDITEDIKILEDMLETVNEIQKGIARLDEPSKAFICMKKGTATIEEAEHLLNELKSSRKTREMVQFKIDPKVKSFAMNLTWYGKDRTFLSFEPPMALPHLYTAKLENHFDVKARDDKAVCAIVSACQIQDGTVLLADETNRKIKQLDVTCKVIDYLELSNEPSAICEYGDDKVAVSLNVPNGTIVQFIETSPNLRIASQFALPFKCMGISSYQSSLYVSSGDAVHQYTQLGEHVGDIYSSRKGSLTHVAASKDGRKIYIVDTDEGLVTVDREGHVLNLFREEAFRNVTSVCLDNYDQVFLCCGDDRSIIQLGHDSQTLGNLLSGCRDLKNPLCICFDRINSRILVSRKGANFVKVIEVK